MKVANFTAAFFVEIFNKKVFDKNKKASIISGIKGKGVFGIIISKGAFLFFRISCKAQNKCKNAKKNAQKPLKKALKTRKKRIKNVQKQRSAVLWKQYLIISAAWYLTTG